MRAIRIKAMAAIRFQYDMPAGFLEQTMVFEAVYPENLQMPLEPKRDLLQTPGAVMVWMFVDGEMAGEAYGIPMQSYANDMRHAGPRVGGG
jgi:hypothetical protein